MEVVSLSPLPVGSVAWQPRQGTWVLTFACKATFQLLPGRADLAQEQEPLYQEDRHWSDDPSWSLYAPSDVAPARRRVDVVLVGEAFAPAGKQVRSLLTRLRVGEIDKRIEVWGERSMGPDGAIFEGPGFTRMPLLWERAAGGPETANPVGMRIDAKDAYGRRMLPNLVPPGLLLRGVDEVVEPVGFGPIAPSWPQRQGKLGRYAGAYSDREWMRQPLPPGIDAGYFSAAPWDQEIERLRDDERLVLDHLHPDHPHLSTQLPGHHPRAFVTRPGGGGQPVRMQIELLWIRTDLGLCTATWRGQVRLDRADEEGRVVVALEEPGQTVAWEDIAGGSASGASPAQYEEEAPITIAPRETRPPPAGPRPDRRPPTLSSSPDATGENPIVHFARAQPSALPFASPAAAAALPFTPPAAAGALPFAPPSTAPTSPRTESSAQRLSGTPFTPAPAPVAPPAVAPPPAIAPPPVVATPPAVGSSPPVAPPPAPSSPGSFGPVAGSAPPPGFAPPPMVRQQSLRTIGESVAGSPSTMHGAEGPGASAGALGASNAAAAASASWLPARASHGSSAPPLAAGAAPTAAGGREVLQILWFDPESAPRFRRQVSWQKILEDLEKKPLDKEHEDPALGREPAEIEDRREVFEILVRGSATDAEGMDEALAGAIRSDGKLVPPLRILAGDLIFPFDEVDALKATIAAVTPFVGQDENLRASIANAQEFLKADLRSAPTVAEGLRVKVAEAWAQGKRPTPLGYLESTTERALLEGRCYQRQKLLGGKHLRALAQAAGSQTLLPAYLPEALADQLPLYQRFRVRAIVEVHMQVDQYEVQPLGLRVLALARVAPAARRDR